MPFTTDHAWSPSTYRRALETWRTNAPANDSEMLPRQAEASGSPRHDKLARQLRNLLTWRAMHRGDDWTLIAANDNTPADGEALPALLDSAYAFRPRTSEIIAAIRGVEFAARREARLGGGGREVVVPVGGDVERGEVIGQGRRRLPDCITRLGKLRFSNGAAEEPAMLLQEGKAVRGSITIPLGGMTWAGKHRPHDRYGKPKGAANDNSPPTVGISNNCNPGAVDFVDPVADVQHAGWIRRAVGSTHAGILDLALVAANFREIGESLGLEGKTAERRGKAALIAACGALDKALAS